MLQVDLSSQKVGYDSPDIRRRLGLIALATDLTTEHDFSLMIPVEKANVFGTRVAYQNPTTPENLRKMAPRITAAAELLVPVAPLDAVCYSCTAASVVIGDEEIAAAINAVLPDVPVITPSWAALKALQVLNVHKVSILTPYLVETSGPMAEYFSHHGLDIQSFHCLGIDDDRLMARVSQASIVNAALATDTPQTEGFFLSCTALPAIGAISEVESVTGKPVVTSNQATAWALMRYAGLSHNPGNYGRLFEHDLPLNIENERSCQ